MMNARFVKVSNLTTKALRTRSVGERRLNEKKKAGVGNREAGPSIRGLTAATRDEERCEETVHLNNRQVATAVLCPMLYAPCVVWLGGSDE